MTMTSQNEQSTWISVPAEQGSTEEDWIEFQPSISSILKSITKRAGTNSTTLVCWDDELPANSNLVIRQDGAIYQGKSNVTSSSEIEVDRLYSLEIAGLTNTSTFTESYLNGISNIQFSSDGFKLFINSTQSSGANYVNVVHQYTLTTSYSVSSRTYDNKNYIITDLGAIDNLSYFTFSPDGTKLYNTGSHGNASGGNNNIIQHTLTTAWDVSTAAYSTHYYTGTSSSPKGVAFNPTGTKMYALIYDTGTTTYHMKEYDLTTAWDVSTALYNNITFNLAVSATGPHASISFTSAGTVVYILGVNTNDVYQYSLSTAWDVSTMSYNGIFFDNPNTSNGCFVSEDRQTLYTMDEDTDPKIRTYDLPPDIPFYRTENVVDITNFSLTETPQYVFNGIPEMRVCLEDTSLRCISRDTPMSLYGLATDQIQVVYSDVLNQILTSSDTIVTDDGEFTVTSVVDSGNTTPVPSLTASFDTSVQQNNIVSVKFSGDGLTMYTLDSTAEIFVYALTTPHDVSTASFSYSRMYPFYDVDSTASGMYFSPDGKNLYLVGPGQETVFQWYLVTPWDITTAHYSEKSLNVTAQTTNPYSLKFNEVGTRMYIADAVNDNILQYKLSIPWDMSTAAYQSVALDITPDNNGNFKVSSFDFAFDGTKLIVEVSGHILQYDLPDPWYVGSGIFEKRWDAPFQGFALDMDFYQNGEILVMTIRNSSTDMGVHEYTMAAPYSIGGDKIWNINLPLSGTIPTYVNIKDRSTSMAYGTTLIAGDVHQYGVSVSTSGSMNHTFDSVNIQPSSGRAIQVATIADKGTSVSDLTVNLWAEGTPTTA